MSIVRFLVRSRIWVAFAASLLSVDLWLTNQTGFPFISVFHVFFLALCGYLFVDDSESPAKKIIMYLGATGAVLGIMMDPLFNMWPLCMAAMMLASYHAGWRKNLPAANFELRKMPGLKNLVIAFCWVLVAAAAMLHNPSQQPISLWFSLLANALFIATLSIAEDMRDMHDDAFPTLISVFGRGKSILLSGVLLVCSYFFGLMHSDVLYNHMSWIFYALLVFLLLLWLRKKRNRDLASFLIDGIIVAKGATQILIVTL